MTDKLNYDRRKFLGAAVITLAAGIGHNLPQEAPKAFAEAIVEVDHLSE